MNEYIYLIQELRFIRTGENIYKVGKTTRGYDRIKEYAKGSRLLLFMNVSNCHEMEKLILIHLSLNFNKRTDIGREYFEGDHRSMIELIKSIKDVNIKDVNNESITKNIGTKKRCCFIM